MSILVDASVVAQRLVTEADSEKATTLLADWVEARLYLLAPELLAVEIGNVLLKRGLLPSRESFLSCIVGSGSSKSHFGRVRP